MRKCLRTCASRLEDRGFEAENAGWNCALSGRLYRASTVVVAGRIEVFHSENDLRRTLRHAADYEFRVVLTFRVS